MLLAFNALRVVLVRRNGAGTVVVVGPCPLVHRRGEFPGLLEVRFHQRAGPVVPETLAHRGSARPEERHTRAVPDSWHAVVLDGVAVLVKDQLAVLAVVYTTGSEGYVAGPVPITLIERFVLGCTIDFELDAAVVHLVETERVLDIALREVGV